MSIHYNPYNPSKSYREYCRQQSQQHSQPQATPQPKLRQSLQVSTHKTQFDTYIEQLEKQRKISNKLVNQHLKMSKQVYKPPVTTYERDLQSERIKYLIEQEKLQKVAGEENQEEFEKNRQKQIRVWKIKNFVSKTRKLKFQNRLTDVLNEIKDPHYMKGRYLLNEDKEREKKLAKPVFQGYQSAVKQQMRRRTQFLKESDVDALSDNRIFNIFLDEMLPVQRQLTTEQTVQDIQIPLINQFTLD